MSAEWVQEFKKREVKGEPMTKNMQRKMNGSVPSAKAKTRNPVRTEER